MQIPFEVSKKDALHSSRAEGAAIAQFVHSAPWLITRHSVDLAVHTTSDNYQRLRDYY